MLLMPFTGFAQQQLQHQKKKFQRADGTVFWQVDLPVFLSLSTSSDGSNAVPLKSNNLTDTLYFAGHGLNYIKRSASNPGRWRDVSFGVRVDGKAPTTSIQFADVPKYVRSGTTYYGKGLTASLSAKDQTDMSGLDQILHSIDGGTYTVYSNTLTLNQQKKYDLKFYAVDSVGNVEDADGRTFFVDLTSPKLSYTLSGDRIEDQNILSPRSRIELIADDATADGTSAGVKRTSYQFDNKSYLTYGSKISVASLSDGDHTFYYRSVDHVENQTDLNYSFYLDKTVPVLTAEIEGDTHQANGLNYISERSRIKLTATDNKAGVKQIDYLIDGTGVTTYNAPFQVDKKQGKHRVSYYGIDNVENKGAAKTDAIMNTLYLDLTAPTINKNYVGQQFNTRDTIFINASTQVRLTATDGQSGVQKINYKLDGQGEVEYNQPFTVNQAGAHSISYSSTDNVNNKKDANFYFVVDNTGPEIVTIFSTKSLGKHTEGGSVVDKYPSHNSIFLGSSDDIVGAKTIYYSLDGAVEKIYTTPIATSKKGMRTLKIRVVDQVKNETTQTISFFVE